MSESIGAIEKIGQDPKKNKLFEQYASGIKTITQRLRSGEPIIGNALNGSSNSDQASAQL